jgi:diguanylate cyclase (GGDEF)-like protein
MERYSILIVDDQAGMRKTLGGILEEDYEISEAETGNQALEQVKKQPFNLVIIDIRLPDIDGIEVLRNIKKINEDIIAIMISGYATIETAIKAMNEGAYSYIAKPFNLDEVKAVIKRALEEQRLSRENKQLLIDLKKANERLEKANKELEELNRVKSEFVSTVSHELRTPLTTMKEFVALILDEIPGKINKEQAEFLNIINENINRLARLINNMLDLSRIESGRMELNRREINMNTVAEEVIKSLQAQAIEKDILLQNLLPNDLPTVYADFDKILQVLTNLVDNAIKFTQKGGKVIIVGNKINEQVEVSVIDSGIGIAKEDCSRIFDKFQRIELPTTQQIRGSGLGLSICKAILELHNGNIRVESEVGKGSNFTFSLPTYEPDIPFKESLSRKFKWAVQNQSFLSLIIVNIDNLAIIKSNFGDTQTHELLTEVEDVVKNTVREANDVVTRHKKNEIVSILSEVDKKGALAMKNRILEALQNHKFKIDVAISSGVATYPDDATTEEELVKKAEEQG